MKRKRGPVTYTELQKNEVMKEIEGFPEYYITNQGRVLSDRPLGRRSQKPTKLREVALSYGSERYYYANIYNENGVRASLRVHRVVFQHFNPNGEPLKEGYVIDHINHDKLDNHIDNLRQITQSENSKHYHNNKKSLQNG
jgi:hypothetical protein